MSNTAKFRVILKDYPEEFIISNKRRAKYWKKGDVLPKYIQDKIFSLEYDWKTKGKNMEEMLYDKVDEAFVVKNKKVAGTPRYQRINSQVMWEAGAGSEWTIRAMKDFLKGWFAPAITRQLPERVWPPLDSFIQLEYIFFYPFERHKAEWRKYQDYINHCFVRSKVFEDTLVELGVIPDDGPEFVRGGYMRYVAIPPDQERHMDIVIHFCKNNEIISHAKTN